MIHSGATFSLCGLYRTDLHRIWGDGGRLLVCCALNCSTADARKNDPTVERMVRRARMWGYDGFVMVNLFAFRSTDPAGLLTVADPVGPDNDAAILHWAKKATLFLCGWGSASPLVPERARDVVAMLRTAGIPLHYLRMLPKSKQPGHPLYIGYDVLPTPWPHV